MIELAKKYNHLDIEKKWIEYWEKEKIHSFDREDTTRPIYFIDAPPPTISGKIHMGHSYSGAQLDFFARYKRLKNYNVLHPFGTDDNGLPTQKLIEKIKNVKAQKMNRDEFVKLCLDTLEKELRPDYIDKFRRLGMSIDFSFYYTTIDSDCRKLSQESFLDLYKKEKIYRMDAPTMWCPLCQTAVAQVDLEDVEHESYFNDIVFLTEDEKLIVSTTRPELLSSCVALFYNPKDERYKHLKGKFATVPLFNYKVPILEDDKAQKDKGTGLVMCCTFGDVTDVEWQKIHKLPIKESISKDGVMTDLAKDYKGLKIKEAREKIIEDLKKQELLISQKKINHAVNTHERCKTPIEFIKSNQWFLKYLDIKDEMLAWADEFKWVPEYYKHRYLNWVKGLNWDWCISRQIPFGIPFPLWFCKECDEIILAKEEDLPIDPLVNKPPVEECPKCKSKEILPEKDVMTTWATSSLTPTIVKEKLKGHKTFNLVKDKPTDLRCQGHDIISFWLFNTLVKSKMHYGIIPWNTAYINGWILGYDGKKMSKSRGNAVEPEKIFENSGADALRYLSGICSPGQDLAFPEKELVAGKKTIVKLFNSTKFALIHIKDYKPSKEDLKEDQKIDVYLLNRLNEVLKSYQENLDNFEYSKALHELNNFFWKELCDNYIEIVKDRLYNPDRRGFDEKKSAQYVLYKTFLEVLKMYSVFMPFITEELYHSYFIQFEGKKSIHLLKFLEIEEKIKEDKETSLEVLKLISAIRNYKSKNNLSLKNEIKKITIKTNKPYNEYIEDAKGVTISKEIIIDKNLENINYEYEGLKLEIII